VDSQLKTLIDLQQLDTRIAGLEGEAARLPKQLAAIEASLAEASKTVETLKARTDATRKELRAKEKDLEVTAGKRTKAEARLYEVKTNKEYSAVLVEIEEIKQEKGRTEEEILGLMETQERLATDIRESETRLKARQEQARQDETMVRGKLAKVEADLTAVRSERETCAREIPPLVLAGYERVLRARAGVAVSPVSVTGVCGGCRVTIRPQVLQELRSGSALMTCESCGRYLYWQD
jgi:predicted  nucleic acid-binding Zn-ribbon protein